MGGETLVGERYWDWAACANTRDGCVLSKKKEKRNVTSFYSVLRGDEPNGRLSDRTGELSKYNLE